ncbi:MAG: serine/threonine-protein kinase [Ktedonobacteraceae bacterium]
MSPEALIGMEVGKGVLQRLLGQGTMGTVYLASQSQRQVAVKVFFPASQLEQVDHKEFQQRLAQVIVQGALLDHEHILGVLDYGEQAGFLYQVMPYIVGESLQQLLAHSGPLPFARIQLYLEQLATALDYAHAQGVLHRDIKPENILLTPEGGLLLADFGLAGLTTERNFARVRRATSGMLNAIAPECVLNKPADKRADLYSLGVVLYHMVTGRTPFQSASIIEVAMQHVNAAPPAPSSLRTDLPQAAAQVMLRALAKDPTERYTHAQELASAFRLAMAGVVAGPPRHEPAEKLALNALHTLAGGSTAKRLAVPRHGGLFDPKWQAIAAASTTQIPSGTEVSDPVSASLTKNLRRPGLLNLANLQVNTFDAPIALDQNQAMPNYASMRTPVDQLAFNASSVQDTGTLFEQPTQNQHFSADNPLKWGNAPTSRTGELAFFAQGLPLPNNNKAIKTTELSEPAKIIQVPVEGGDFKTGFRHIQPDDKQGSFKQRRNKRMQVIGLVLAALIVVVGSGMFWFAQNSSSRQARTAPNPSASATAHSKATVNANLILADDLSQNARNWVVGPQGSFNYAFKDGAYLITNADKTNSASALLPNKVLNAPFAYSLTMEQLQGDLSSPNNQFGMLLDTTSQNTNGTQIDTFYAFEVVNKPGGQYQFWKYDNRKDSAHPWTLLWNKGFGAEFLQGSGPTHLNTLKVMAVSKNFTFMVNGTQVGMWQDGSFTSGSIGMLVNLNGAEVAFSHLLVTYT